VKIVVLDSGPLGIVTNPRATPTNDACRHWLLSLLENGVEVVLPEIADYEVRRELLRAERATGLRRLDTLKAVSGVSYVPLTTATMNRAAALWAQARRRGAPTADSKELDGDVIQAAQAESVRRVGDDLVIATTNVGHLTLLLPAERWQDIAP
jgi:hypothetical protein